MNNISKDEVYHELKKIVLLLSANKFDELHNLDHCKRITSAGIKTAISEFPGLITFPPNQAYNQCDIYEVSESLVRVDFELWFDGEKSDLTLCCSFYKIDDCLHFCLDDIRVL